jgi:hypothetical protein
MTSPGTDERDEELSAAARSLHREWESPQLWPDIAAGMRAQDQQDRIPPARLQSWIASATGWQSIAAAAVVVLALSSASWLGWRSLQPTMPAPDAAAQERLLTEDALAAIERSEAQYVQAIDELTRMTAPRLDMPDAPLLVNLRERLLAIDMAIAECRSEIARNRFNAHLRRQLLWIYQEKRRTLEQIQEYDPDAL